VTGRAWQSARLDELERSGGRSEWIPVRRRLGVKAFGVNAWAGDAGDTLIREHEEVSTGHEELYVVLSGRAEFTVGGETVDAPPGTVVFVRDPATHRAATAKAAGTMILSAGAKPGEPYEPQPWEVNSEVLPIFDRGEFAAAKALLVEALEERPNAGGLLYNLACAESQLGETEAALEHLRRAVEISDEFAEYAKTDADLEPIRADPRFPVAS
jgi:mannose-6-phosphate isomerase-like protein (cupin superfamily)